MAKYRITPSSKAIIQLPISIGHKAEKGVEAIEFDLTAWVETYGSGTLTVIMRRWGDAIPYPIALEIDENNKATWTLSDIDTARAGMAYAQLSYIVGETVVKKSDIYTFRVMDSLTGEGEPPEAYESWLEHLTHLAAEAMAEVLDIEGIVTDKTLTVDGGIADAKATGDALALKADKSTTYTKTEVDQMIEDVEVETDTTLEIAGAPADAAETGRQIGLLKADLGAVTTATADDVGLALKVKTVTNGKVTAWEFGEAGSGDAEALEARVEAIENVEPTYLLEGVEWEFGGISGGNNSTSDHNRIRTVGYIAVPEGLTVIPFELSNGVYIGVHALTSAKAFISDSGWQNAASYAYTVPENTAFIRIVLHNKSNSNMSDTSESDNVFVNLSPQFIKDFLAMENALDSKYDKSETYSKAEVAELTGIADFDLLDGVTWEFGSLGRDTGKEESSSTVIRTPYISILTPNTWLDMLVDDGNYRVFFYNAEHSRITDVISYTGSDMGWIHDDITSHKVPEGTAYVRFIIKDATAVTDASRLSVKAYSIIGELNAEAEQDIGEAVPFEYGVYYGSTSITESQIEARAFTFADAAHQGKRALVHLKAGNILRLHGIGLSPTRQLYKAFDASTGVMIDNLTASTTAGTYYLRYKVDANVYITAKLGSNFSARVIKPSSLAYDLTKSMPGAGTPIIDLNDADKVIYALKGLTRKHYNGRNPVVLVHFSDIHGDVANTQRIVDFVTDSKVSRYINDTICTGDIVAGVVTDANPFDSVSGAENIICVPGNHDSAKGSGSATLQEVYEKLYTGKIGNWGVTQPEGGASSYLGYFYKDYTTQKLRVIFLDSNHDNTYITTQASWLADILESARTADLSVMCVNHYFFDISTVQYVDCGFSPGYHWVGGAFASVPSAFVTAVETFITNGGDFVCWLGGHGHQDYVIKNSTGNQLEIGISCATDEATRATGDEVRESGTKSQDCVNVLSIDTYCKRISILRLGVDRSRLMVSKKHLCLDYANRSVIWSD